MLGKKPYKQGRHQKMDSVIIQILKLSDRERTLTMNNMVRGPVEKTQKD